MSKPFEWKDFTKKYNDLSTNNFPVFSKAKQVQDTLKFKFSSKAQQGVKFDSSVTNYDGATTEADFSAKVNLNEVKGLELGFKAKSKPSAEFSAKVDDRILKVDGLTVTTKVTAASPSDQGLGLSVGFVNNLVNLNVGYVHPLTQRLFDFIEEKSDKSSLADQRSKVEVDFVSKPVEGQDYYVGGATTLTLPKDAEELTYTSKFSAALQNRDFVGGVSVEHKKQKGKEAYEHNTSYEAFAYTEADDLSGGARVSYNPADSKGTYKGVSVEVLGGVKRDADSNISTKIQIVPDTTVSLGFDQRINKNTKLSFGYSFLVNKASEQSKTKHSAYHFGLELSH